MARVVPKANRTSAQQVKVAAQKLFAERGVDGVTVRDIAVAAGQKNHGIVGYYFGSKEALVRELIMDGAKLIDNRRNALLDEMEARGAPVTVREVVDVLVFPAIDGGREASGDLETYNRFAVMLSMTHRELFLDAMEGRWNSGYARCLAHLSRLMPPMAVSRRSQRLVFLGNYLGGVLANREAALSDTTRDHPMWRSPQTLEHFARSLTALLEMSDAADLGAAVETPRAP